MPEEEGNQNALAGADAGQAGRGRDKALHVMLICIFPGAASFSKQSSITTKSYLPYPYTSHNCLLVAKSCPTLFDPTVRQVPLSMGFLRQEYWSGLPGDLPNLEIELESSVWQVDSLPQNTWEAHI